MKKDKKIIVFIIVFLFVFSTNIQANIVRINTNDESLISKDNIVLITGFEPFDVYDVNPSKLVAESLDGQIIDDAYVVGIVLPVDFEKSVENITKAIIDYDPVLVISLGLAASRNCINVENLGINLKRYPRNESSWIFPRRIDKCGPFIKISSLETIDIVDRIKEENISVKHSFYAGMYVCNAVLYRTLKYIQENELSIKAGFMHLPLLLSQDPEGMELDTMIDAVVITVETSLD